MTTKTTTQIRRSADARHAAHQTTDTETIPKAYEPHSWEDTLYARWEESGFFNPDHLVDGGVVAPDAPVFSMVLPPPNVTGSLHVGHATMLAIQDILTRFHRMRGYRTLWLPGTDHAAIATQSKVEGIIHKTEDKTRHDFSREDFLRRVEDFAQASHDTIVNQTKKMGSSLDWSREAYTLDEQRSRAVRHAFKQMYDDGIIYRGNRIVNWDPKLQTTVSDDEIERKEEVAPLYYLQYGPFIIATARPETKFGDKYVVVHPDDERYAEYSHGQTIELEWINGLITATVIKDEAIDMAFGTGAMTITPWHDAIDFDIAERHGLDVEQVIDFEGKLLPIAGEFAEMPIHEARPKIVEKLRTKGLVLDDRTEHNYVHSIATNSRGGGVIEPQIKLQWFIGVNREFERNEKKTTLKQLMQEAVSSGDTKILPERFTKTYFHWIDNLRDWCISRQIWYGHRIPVWYRSDEIYCGTEAPQDDGWVQDSDTLDTWFSSGLWTFSTLGWGTEAGKNPEEAAEWLKNKIYHPTSVLETGYDILFFWVARMILMSTYFLGEVPFKNVYLHGLVRDEQGRKMSKSLGNVLDPLDIIPTYGADALRLALVLGSTPGNDIKIGEEKIKSSRNFTNKLWNIGRYVLTQSQVSESTLQLLTPIDHWIFMKLHTVIDTVTAHLENYNFSLAGETLRDFTWNEFADWYIEFHKTEKNDAVLRFVFETLLKLWHPFMPFVTEALWSELHRDAKNLLMVASWPQRKEIVRTTQFKAELAGQFGYIIQPLITSTRNLRSIYHINPQQKLSLFVILKAETLTQKERGIDIYTNKEILLQNQDLVIKRLARLETIHIAREHEIPNNSAQFSVGNMKVFVHLEGILDIAQEIARLTKEQAETRQHLSQTEARLNNEKFVQGAPAAVVDGVRAEQARLTQKLAQLTEALDSLK